MHYEKYYQQFLEQNPYPRKLKSLEPLQGSSSVHVNMHGKKFINFSSSDYLGLAKHPLLIQRSHEYTQRFGIGSGSSRLVTGNFAIYETLEQQLASALNKPSALILGTGYQTNFTVLEALLDSSVLKQEPLVFCDRLAHVSMLASTRYLTRIQRFQHNDLNHLETLLKKFSDSSQPKFILVESVYSMDGDETDLQSITALAKKYHADLYVDDAHAVGIYGKQGWGKAPEYAEHIPIIMGTFSKALGSFGGYIACSETVRQYLVNRCKGLIYSTGPSPAILGAISAVLEILPTMEERRQRALKNAEQLRNFFKENGLDFGRSSSHIVPWIIGDAKQTLQAAQWLEEYGVIATGIQPPSVPPHGSRIRFCLSAEHSEEDLNDLMEAIRKVAIKL